MNQAELSLQVPAERELSLQVPAEYDTQWVGVSNKREEKLLAEPLTSPPNRKPT